MTNKRPWTKGPWEALESPWGSGDEFLVLRKSSVVPIAECCRLTWKKNRANARLMAAAPQLYEALEQTRNWIKTFVHPCDDEGNEGFRDDQIAEINAALREANPGAFESEADDA